MFAVVLHEFGPARNLRYEQVDDPKPGPGQVRIAVRAAGVHLIDTSIRKGGAGAAAGPVPALPMIGGREVAGTVDQLGSGVPEGWLGRHVVAHLGLSGGGYAELAVVNAEALHPLDPAVDDAEAVAMVGTGRTAIGILEATRLAPADVVVITSAAGGLGALLIQAGRQAGAHVVGAAGGPAKVQQVAELGADLAVDYDEPGWTGTVRTGLGGRGVTAVLDGVGGTRGRGALELLGPDGRIVFYGFSSGEPTALSVFDLIGRGITASAGIGARLLRRPGGLHGYEDQALAALAAGTLVPLISRFSLAEAAVAHTALENRQTTGKVVLIP